MEYEILKTEDEDTRQDGLLYVELAGWQDETRKRDGLGRKRYDRHDGGTIRADWMNSHKIQVNSRSILANGRVIGTRDVMADLIIPAVQRANQRIIDRQKFRDNRGTTLNLQVASSNDDAYQRHSVGSNTTATSSDDCYNNTSSASNRRSGGWRWDNVTVPAGATIDSADVQLYITSTSTDDPYGTVYFEDADDPGDLTGTALRSRTFTSASTSVNATAVGTGFYTISVTSAVAEVVARGGWASGQAMVCIFDTGSDNSNRATVRDYVSNSSQAAKLDIDYTEGGGDGASRLTLLGTG